MDETRTQQENSRYLPAVGLRKTVVLPGQIMDLDIVREDLLKILNYARMAGKNIFVYTQEDEEPQTGRGGIEYGVICLVQSADPHPQAHHPGLRVRVQALQKARLLEFQNENDILTACILPIETDKNDSLDARRMRLALKELFHTYASSPVSRVSSELRLAMRKARTLDEAMQTAALALRCDYQILLQILNAPERSTAYDLICIQLETGIENAELLEKLRDRVREHVDKNQRDYLLREQMKVIQEELGEETPQSEAEEFSEKLAKLSCPEEIRDKIGKQIRRFRSIAGNSQEAAIVRTYIETLLDMPWDAVTEDNDDLGHAAAVLEQDHYGLEDIKDRILEYLAVRRLTEKGDSPILCLAGPPGTGKTSIARSVARALERKYVRIGLGGVHDESEIRGHRRTYVGAMPGRIAAALRQAGVKNPVILLDEIDKLNASYNGDPAAALLEALDSEQNSHFSDHYIDMPLDLSQVLFIATANDLNTVPAPLRDRLEIIEVGSYTDNEKFHIAKEYLLPKQKEHNGLSKKQLSVTDKAMHEIISGWTSEAGVRSLERQLGRICRRAARLVLENGEKTVRIKAGNIQEFLGRRKFEPFGRNRKDEPGIVRGLAWTRIGGVTLEVEVNILPGTGKLHLTGQMGDVMKESASAAMTYIRSVAEEYHIEPAYFAEHDFHLHIPEGAVPKDGPSAGITMASALLSAAAQLPARADTAMTGEITLRGRVLAIGGLKEKLLAARKAGMKQVIVPEANKAAVAELSEEIIGDMHIVYAGHMKEVLSAVLVSV